MPKSSDAPYSEMAILRRVVDPDQPFPSAGVAKEILRLRFGGPDRARMNRLAAKNRAGKLKPSEQVELDNFIRVGQTLGILQSKARRSLRGTRSSHSGEK